MGITRQQVKTRSGRVATSISQTSSSKQKKSVGSTSINSNKKQLKKVNNNEETEAAVGGRSARTSKNKQPKQKESETKQIAKTSRRTKVPAANCNGTASNKVKVEKPTAKLQMNKSMINNNKWKNATITLNLVGSESQKPHATRSGKGEISYLGTKSATKLIELNRSESRVSPKRNKSQLNESLSPFSRLKSQNGTKKENVKESPTKMFRSNFKRNNNESVRKSTRLLNKSSESPRKSSTKQEQIPIKGILREKSSKLFTCFVNIEKLGINSKANNENELESKGIKIQDEKRVNLLPKLKSPIRRVQFENAYKELRPRRANKKYVDSCQSSQSDDECDNKAPIYKKAAKVVQKIKKDVYAFSSERSQSDSDNEYDKEMKRELKLIEKLEKKTKYTYTQTKRRVRAKPKTGTNTKTSDKLPKQSNIIKNGKKQGQIVKNKNITVLSNVLIKPAAANLTKAVDMMVNLKKTLNNENDVLKKKENEVLDNDAMPEPIDDNEEEENPLVVFKEPTLPKSDLNVTYNDFQRLNANRTMTRMSSSTPISSPWRPHLVYRNGPHFLQTKKTSLPAFNQEMVLNSTMVEEHQPGFNCRLSAITNSNKATEVAQDKNEQNNKVTDKKTKQTSILTFVHGMEPPDDDCVMNCTLFDENLLLSPMKASRVSPRRSLKDTNKTISPDRKRVLRDRSNFITHDMDTPERGSSDVDFFASTASVVKVNSAYPTRFILSSLKHGKKAIINKDLLQETSDNVEKEIQEVQTVEENQAETSVAQSENHEETQEKIVGIFEDYGDLGIPRPEPSFTYARKRKRNRRVSYASEHSADEDVSHDEFMKKKRRHKKKGEMTKKEQTDYDKWAKSFNAMCDKVDKFELEVEKVKYW